MTAILYAELYTQRMIGGRNPRTQQLLFRGKRVKTNIDSVAILNVTAEMGSEERLLSVRVRTATMHDEDMCIVYKPEEQKGV